jgi:hypothetical protein
MVEVSRRMMTDETSLGNETREAAEDLREKEELSVPVGTGLWDKTLASAK